MGAKLCTKLHNLFKASYHVGLWDWAGLLRWSDFKKLSTGREIDTNAAECGCSSSNGFFSHWSAFGSTMV